MKSAVVAFALLAAVAAQAGGAVKTGTLPFNLNDGRNIQANLPSMKRVNDYVITVAGATFKTDIPCSATGRRPGAMVPNGHKLFGLRTGFVGAVEGCAFTNQSQAEVVIWEDGSESMIPKDAWEGFIPNYMK